MGDKEKPHGTGSATDSQRKDGANPSDCNCEHVHASSATCPSKQPSRGAVAESRRVYPAASLDGTREEFEKWAKAEQYDLTPFSPSGLGPTYTANPTEIAWIVWQASRSSERERVAELEAELATMRTDNDVREALVIAHGILHKVYPQRSLDCEHTQKCSVGVCVGKGRYRCGVCDLAFCRDHLTKHFADDLAKPLKVEHRKLRAAESRVEELQRQLSELTELLRRAEGAMSRTVDFLGFYMEREQNSPSNSQEACREAREDETEFNSALAALRSHIEGK